MTNTQSLVLSVVEGLTEYLPVSSTGHIILASWVLGINQEPFVKDFTVMVQFGAILAVVVLYWKRFILNFKIYPQVFIAVLPAVVIGLALKKHIEELLGSVAVVGWALFVGGVLLVLTDRWVSRLKVRLQSVGEMKPKSALTIGLFQCLAMIPGTSRSAATIWGGLFEGMSLQLATEFSFFLAVPTLTGAALLELRKVLPSISHEQVQILLVGNVVSFVVGAITIKSFVTVITRYGLRVFGYYRIVAGLGVLLIFYFGSPIQMV